MATAVMSGLVTTIGLLTESAAALYQVKITEIASQFSWLISGFSLGYVMSFFVFDYFPMRRVIVASYGVALLSVLFIHFVPLYSLVGVLFLAVGTCSGIMVCAAGTLIARFWHDKARQSVLVAQDAVFNAGGACFAWLVPLMLANSFAWSATWMTVTVFYVPEIILALVSSLEHGNESVSSAASSQEKTEWNAGFILIGVSLFLFLFAKIVLFVWAPQFVEQKFMVGGAESGQFMSNIFTAAMLGSIAGVYVVSRINVKYVLYSLVILAILSTWMFMLVTELKYMYLVAFVFGISISATYNSYVAYALNLVKSPNHKHIAYLNLMGGVGSALGPMVSSQVVEMRSGTASAISLSFATYIIVFIILLAANILHARAGKSINQ